MPHRCRAIPEPHTHIPLYTECLPRIPQPLSAGASRSGRSNKTASVLQLAGLLWESTPKRPKRLQNPSKTTITTLYSQTPAGSKLGTRPCVGHKLKDIWVRHRDGNGWATNWGHLCLAQENLKRSSPPSTGACITASKRFQNSTPPIYHTQIWFLRLMSHPAEARTRRGRSDKTGKRSAAWLIAGVLSKATEATIEFHQSYFHNSLITWSNYKKRTKQKNTAP